MSATFDNRCHQELRFYFLIAETGSSDQLETSTLNFTNP